MLCRRRSFSEKRHFCSNCTAGSHCFLPFFQPVRSARMLCRRYRCRYTACMLAFGCCPGSRKRKGQRLLSCYLQESIYRIRQNTGRLLKALRLHKNQYTSPSCEVALYAELVLSQPRQLLNLRPELVEFGPANSQSLQTISPG